MQKEHENNFQKLNIFEDDIVNKACDHLIEITKEITSEDLLLWGSVAKILDEKLPKFYEPKDADFVLSPWAFRLLKSQLREFENVLSIEVRPNRIILYISSKICIEIFEKNTNNFTHKIYKSKIKYVI